LILSGLTSIPLEAELDFLVNRLGLDEATRVVSEDSMSAWLVKVRDAIRATNRSHPFMAYGTDWLAFGHFVIAVAFLGTLRDPVRNRWLYRFGMIACVLVAPYALIFGGIRGIPIGWRLIDCSFGLFGSSRCGSVGR
jgi:hypothetical protein